MTESLQSTPDQAPVTSPVVSVGDYDLQSWVVLGAAFVAWTTGDRRGTRAVLDRDDGVLALDGRGCTVDDGYEKTVSLPGDTVDELAEPVAEWRDDYPVEVLSTGVPDTGDRTHPAAAPIDAAAESEVVPLRLSEWGDGGKTGYAQAWRPLDAAAAYVGLRVGDFVDWYGTYDDGVAYFDALPPEIHLGVEDRDDRIRDAVEALR